MASLNPQAIIVRVPNWLGDAVMATPVLVDLRAHYPRGEITVMCQEQVAPLFTHDPCVDEIFQVRRGEGIFRRMHHRSVISKLRCGKYDLGILLTQSFSTTWQFFQGGVRYRLGYRARGCRFLLTHSLPLPENKERQHLVLTYKGLLTPLGVPLSTTPPRLVLTEEEVEEGWAFVKRFDIERSHKIIGIHPGAAYGTAKCWLPERFKEVARQLVEKDPTHVVLFFGDLASKEWMSHLCAGLGKRVINLSGQTSLRELLALIKLCRVFLTNDSGPMHIADSLEVPLVALFGSTNPVVTGPYRQPQHCIYKAVPCSPCFKRVCPIDFPCMRQIAVEEVMEALFSRLHEGTMGG